MASETTVVPGTPEDWREYPNEDFDPSAASGSDEDTLGALLAERTEEDMFGIIIVADPIEKVSDDLIRRLAGSMIPTKVRREARGGGKVGEKKTKKHKKD